jgi:pimeloyl-ACP methyl ester carboxylesterase
MEVQREYILVQKFFKTSEKAIEYLNLYGKVMKLWPVDYKGYYVDKKYEKTWIHETGDSNLPPLLLLHGMSGSSTQWYPNVDYLSKNFRVITPDIIGQAGKSVLEKPLFFSTDLEKWLDEVINNLGIEQLYLGGLSFGGWLAAKYAIYAPRKVNKLVMLDPAATFLSLKLEFILRMFAAIFIPIPTVGKSFERWLTQGYEMNVDFSKQLEIGMIDYKPMKGQKTIFAKVIPDADLRKLEMPVMVLIGKIGRAHV